MKANRLEMKKKSKCEVFFFLLVVGIPLRSSCFQLGIFARWTSSPDCVSLRVT